MTTDGGYEVIAAKLHGAIDTMRAEINGRLDVLIAQHEAANAETARAHTRIDALEGRIRSNFVLALTGLAFPLLVGGAFFLLNWAAR